MKVEVRELKWKKMMPLFLFPLSHIKFHLSPLIWALLTVRGHIPFVVLYARDTGREG